MNGENTTNLELREKYEHLLTELAQARKTASVDELLEVADRVRQAKADADNAAIEELKGLVLGVVRGHEAELAALGIKQLEIEIKPGDVAPEVDIRPVFAQVKQTVHSALRRTVGHRNRNPDLEASRRRAVQEAIKSVVPSVRFRGRAKFQINTSHGGMHIATTPSGPRQEWWFGIPESEWDEGRLSWVVLDLGDRDITFVIPCDVHQSALEETWRDSRGERKVTVGEEGRRYFLRVKGGTLDLGAYEGAFHLLRPKPKSLAIADSGFANTSRLAGEGRVPPVTSC